MINEEIEQAIEGLDGVVLVDIDDRFFPWSKAYDEYWMFLKLREVCETKAIPVFFNKTRYTGDGLFESYLSLTEGWREFHHLCSAESYETAAAIIEREISKPREETTLGFGGTLADSCVRIALYNMCEETMPPRGDSWQSKTRKDINRKFKKGKLLYELTEDTKRSFLYSTPVRAELRELAHPHAAY